MFGKDTQLTFILILLVVLSGIAGMYFLQTKGIDTSDISFTKKATSSQKYPNNIVLKSSEFGNNETIPEKYTCKGAEINPPLEFVNIPENAQSLILTIVDIDAPVKDYEHWLVYNIDPTTTNVSENSIPGNGIVGQNSLGKGSYIGPCPPAGSHRYEFTVYALNTLVDQNAIYNRTQILEKYSQNILDKATLTGIFGK